MYQNISYLCTCKRKAKINKKSTMTPFQKFIDTLPHGQYATFRASVKLELLKVGIDITDQTFRNWENGTYEPDQPQKRDVINAVAVAMTGKPIY